MAVRFDAAGDYLTRSTGLPAVTAVTVMGWFKISVDRNTYSTFFQYGNTASDRDYQAVTSSDGTTFHWWDGVSSGDGTTNLTVGQWYHIAETVSGTPGSATFLLYVNSVLDATGGVGNTDNDAAGPILDVGNDPFFSDYFNGCAACIKVYGAVLTASEIAQEMRQYRPIRTANLSLWAPLLTHTDVADYSGNGNGFTANGTLATEDGPPIAWSRGQQGRVYIPAGGEPPATIFSMCLLGTGL